MKITKSKLQKIIKEEIQAVLSEKVKGAGFFGKMFGTKQEDVQGAISTVKTAQAQLQDIIASDEWADEETYAAATTGASKMARSLMKKTGNSAQKRALERIIQVSNNLHKEYEEHREYMNRRSDFQDAQKKAEAAREKRKAEREA